jgi:segregation and condensation protein B
MSIKPKLEALIYAAEEPITLDQMASLLREDLLALKVELKHQDAGAQGQLPSAQPAAAGEQSMVEAGEITPAAKRAQHKLEKAELRGLLKPFLEELIAESGREDRGIEIRQVAGGYRMSTKPEHHDVVRAFAKSLKPPVRLSLPALETLAVIAYKQPVTVPEISDIRGVDASAVIGTLLERKLITTAGRKAVVGRPMLYKTSKDFLVRFGLKDLSELPSLEEFEKLAASEMEAEPAVATDAVPDATGIPDPAQREQPVNDSDRLAEASSDPHQDQADPAIQQTGPERSGG